MTSIYINGRLRRVVNGLGPTFYADTDELPGRPCSCHNIGSEAHRNLIAGHSVRTLGNVYSLYGPEWTEFTLDGVKGKVYANGWLSWSTLNCDVNCSFSPELREIVDRLYAELQQRSEKRI